MTQSERDQIEWCIRVCEALHARLSGCNLPNLAGQAAGVRSTLRGMRDAAVKPVSRRRLATATF
jgi:hypothetical protein